jgi:hypothetical protein
VEHGVVGGEVVVGELVVVVVEERGVVGRVALAVVGEVVVVELGLGRVTAGVRVRCP